MAIMIMEDVTPKYQIILIKAKLAIKEMYEQVGSELVYENGVVVRGLIIRHLVLPNGLSESEEVFKFISELDPKIHHLFNGTILSRPIVLKKIFLLNRTIRHSEFDRVTELLHKYGLENGWIQEMESHDFYRPNFDNDREDPFGNKKLFEVADH